jgi:hypothetical protein
MRISWAAGVLLGTIEPEFEVPAPGVEVVDAGSESAPAASSPEEHPVSDSPNIERPSTDNPRAIGPEMDLPDAALALRHLNRRKPNFIESELLEERDSILGRGVSEEAAMEPGERSLTVQTADCTEKPQMVGDSEGGVGNR